MPMRTHACLQAYVLASGQYYSIEFQELVRVSMRWAAEAL